MELVVKVNYRNRKSRYEAGQTIDVPDHEAEFLLRDAPGCFARKAYDAPPQNKMVSAPPKRKGWGDMPEHLVELLEAGGVKSPEQLRGMNGKALLEINGIGPARLEEIRQYAR